MLFPVEGARDWDARGARGCADPTTLGPFTRHDRLNEPDNARSDFVGKSAHEMGLPPAGGETTKEATARKRRPGANCVLNGDEA